MQKSFFGYRRDNGRVGIRNHVLILPLDDLSQPACNAVANNIGGTVAIQHPYGRLQFGADLDLHFRTLIGAGSNPNVAAVIVIGIEEKWTQDVVDGIAKTGKPVAGFGIEQHGQIDTIARASRKAKEFVQYASALQKVECPISDLWVSCKCGESDTTSGLASCPTVGNAFDKLYEEGCTLVFGETTELTGGEHLVKARCANDRVRSEFTAFFDRYAKVIDDHKTSDLSDSQPTKGNIEGGCFVLWIDPPYDADPAKRLGELMHCIKDEMAECEEAVVVKNLKEIEEARKEKSRAYHRNYSREYRARNLEKQREYDRIKAREYRAKKKAQAAAALSAP